MDPKGDACDRIFDVDCTME